MSSPLGKSNQPEEDHEDIQLRVLQNTLDEVANRDDDRQPVECCVICLEAVSEPCELLPCGHVNFDYICLVSWLYETPVCPLCKAAAVKVQHGPPEDRKTTTIDAKPKNPATPSSRGAHASASHGGGRYHRARPHAAPRNHRPRLEPDSARQRRREVYIHNRYSKHVGTNRLSEYRELVPELFCRDDNLVSRARMWIRRELQVFPFLSPDEPGEEEQRSPGPPARRTTTERRRANNAEFLLEYIIAILKSVDMAGSAGQAEEMLSDFLGRDTAKLFLHELRAWLRSPYTKLEDWDRAVQYGPVGSKPATAEPSSSTSRGGDYYRPNYRHDDRRRSRPRQRYEPYRSRSREARGTINNA